MNVVARIAIVAGLIAAGLLFACQGLFAGVTIASPSSKQIRLTAEGRLTYALEALLHERVGKEPWATVGRNIDFECNGQCAGMSMQPYFSAFAEPKVSSLLHLVSRSGVHDPGVVLIHGKLIECGRSGRYLVVPAGAIGAALSCSFI